MRSTDRSALARGIGAEAFFAAQATASHDHTCDRAIAARSDACA